MEPTEKTALEVCDENFKLEREHTKRSWMEVLMLYTHIHPCNNLQAVLEVDEERKILEQEAEELAMEQSDEAIERVTVCVFFFQKKEEYLAVDNFSPFIHNLLIHIFSSLPQNTHTRTHTTQKEIYERLEEMDAATAEMRAAKILHGLGFSKEMQNKKTKDFSGGWRMRISLARALFIRPSILLLDEPTNHLDLEACVWLEMELKEFKHILVLISHSQDFLNGVCTNIMSLHQKKVCLFDDVGNK